MCYIYVLHMHVVHDYVHAYILFFGVIETVGTTSDVTDMVVLSEHVIPNLLQNQHNYDTA